MKDYASYDPIDFAQDDEFVQWTKYPGQIPEIDGFWESWYETHAEKREDINMAKQIIWAVIEEGTDDSTGQIQEKVWNRIKSSIREEKTLGGKSRSLWNTGFRIAAAVLFILAGSATIWWFGIRNVKPASDINYSRLDLVEETNLGLTPKTIVLTDGSSVVLQPQSALQYPAVFNANFREVRLRGEAFFEVTKNPRKPFLVHADKIVAKVLGTSFVIRVLNDESDVLVQVKTGKVSVFREFDSTSGKTDATSASAIVLTPNQQIVYSRGESKMVKSDIENSDLLNASVKRKFEFHDSRLSDVFAMLEEAYGVEIVYDKETIANCSLNASLDDMPLYEKMRLICKVLDTHYEVTDSKIVYHGKACN